MTLPFCVRNRYLALRQRLEPKKFWTTVTDLEHRWKIQFPWPVQLLVPKLCVKKAMARFHCLFSPGHFRP